LVKRIILFQTQECEIVFIQIIWEVGERKRGRGGVRGREGGREREREREIDWKRERKNSSCLLRSD
jgi:hypothetical protein